MDTIISWTTLLWFDFQPNGQLSTIDIRNAIINMLSLQNITSLTLEGVKVSKMGLPTRLEQLEHVRFQSVSMPGSSWISFIQSLQSASLTELILRNLNTDDININLENRCRVWQLDFEDE